MTTEELKSSLQVYYDDYANIGVSVYAVLKNPEVPGPFKLDIEAEALGGLKELFIQSLQERISNKAELTLLNLSGADERTDAIYAYDLDVPEELSSLEAVITQDNLPLLNLHNESLSSVKALLIEIGNNVGQLILYKTMAPVNIFGRSNFFLRKSARRLERLDGEFLRITDGFQMLRINGALLVLDLESLERSFGFHDIVKREAAAGIRAITTAQILADPDVLNELLDDIKYARKLTKVAKASPVLRAKISSKDIVRFCQTFPNLRGRFKFNETQDKIILGTKASKDWFIKLLMDDFLTSDLTKLHYTSAAKDGVDQETVVP